MQEEYKEFVSDVVDIFYIKTRNGDFLKKILGNNYSYSKYKLLDQWREKWVYIMNTVIELREIERSIIITDNKNYRRKRQIKYLVYLSELWYLKQEWEKRDDRCKKIEYEEADFMDCINDILTHSLNKSKDFEDDYYNILSWAFEELETINEMQNKDRKVSDYSRKAKVLKECMDIINPQREPIIKIDQIKLNTEMSN